MSAITVVVHPDPATLATATAARLLVRLIDAQSMHRPVHAVLTGGGLGIRVLAEVAGSPLRDVVDWSGVHLWWGDERFLAAGVDARPAVPVFDVLLLGMGPDGHIASLFPGHQAVHVLDRTVVGVHGSPKPPPERVSLTFPAIEAAEEVWLVVAGADKSAAAGRALAGKVVDRVPGQCP